MHRQLMHGKISSIHSSGKLITRNRPLNLLLDNLHKNLIFVYSPAGYGKTSLIKSMLEKQNWQYAWFNASGEQNHLYTFLRYLIFSLQQLDYTFGYHTLQLIESRREKFQLAGVKPKSLISEIMPTFVKEFNDVFKEDTILVIDNLHSIEESPWFIEIFNFLFSNMPEKLHLVLITRFVHDFNFIPLVEKEQMLKIGMEDLVFRFDEIVELLNKIYSIDYSENGVKLLEKNLGGWITGIHMILQSFGKDFESLDLDVQSIPENAFNLLAEEIFKRLDRETQDFLIQSSIFDDFNSALCSYVFENKNSASIISRLAEKNQFIQLQDSYNGSDKFNYQLFFKSFLHKKLVQKYSESEINNFYKRAAEFQLQQKDNIQSVSYFLKAKEYKLATDLIISSFNTLFNQGKFEHLWKWMAVIEAETEVKNPHVVYFSGCLYKYYIGDLKKALEYIEKAIEMFKSENDTKSLPKCYVTKAGVLLNFGETNQVITELSGLIDEHTAPEIKANLLYFIAYSYYMNSDYDRAVELLHKTLEISNNGELIDKKNSIYNLLGNIELIKGNFSDSSSNYEIALQHKPSLFKRFETLCNLVLLESQTGKYEKAKDYEKKLSELHANIQSPVFKIPYLLAKQAYLFESLRYEENIEVLLEINRIAKVMDHTHYIYLSNRLLSETYHYMHDSENAKFYYKLALETVNENNELEMIELAAADALLNMKPSDKSYEKYLLNAYEYYDKNGYSYSKAQTAYRIANIYYLRNNTEKTYEYLHESLGKASANGYVSFFVREYKYSRNLLDFAVKNKVCHEFVNSVISNFVKE